MEYDLFIFSSVKVGILSAILQNRSETLPPAMTLQIIAIWVIAHAPQT